jgi:hypothetical protein
MVTIWLRRCRRSHRQPFSWSTLVRCSLSKKLFPEQKPSSTHRLRAISTTRGDLVVQSHESREEGHEPRPSTGGAAQSLLWGSDWTHPQYWRPMPSDSDLLDMMLDWVPDETTRNRIFADNPIEAFGFPRLDG